MRGALRAGVAALALAASCLAAAAAGDGRLRGTGDLGIVVERAAGAVRIVETTGRKSLARVEGLGDLSHASAAFSRDGRYAFVFGRDGGLSKIDLLTGSLAKRVVQAGNSIGGAISDDGKLVAVSNYDPGGVRFFDSDSLEPLGRIPAAYGEDGALSKVVGLVDAPGRRFLFALLDAGEIWMARYPEGGEPQVEKFAGIGALPYDGLITPDGRHYVAGLYGEDGLAHIDLWESEPKARRILAGYGRGEAKLPVYKMPHLEGWARAGDKIFLPAAGRHELLVADASSFEEVGRIAVRGQPVFAIARPDGRQVWVNFAYPLNDAIQVIDAPSMRIVRELRPGKGALHMEFTPRGENVWISVRDEDRVEIYDSRSFERLGSLRVEEPSGIFFSARANRIGL